MKGLRGHGHERTSRAGLVERRASGSASAWSWVRLRAIARKEALQVRRDPRSLLLAFLLPVLLLIIFGYAITWDVRDISTVVVDQDRTSASRDLIRAFQASGYFRILAYAEDADAAVASLAGGSALLVLVIPPSFSDDLHAGKPAPLQAIVDGSDANTATIALGYAQAIVREFSAEATQVSLASRTSRGVPISARTRVWYNEEMLSRNMIVPGLIAVIMMIIAAMLTSLTIAREWERGTMEQLAATPVSRLEVVLGKLLPYLIIGLLDVGMASIIGVALFRVPFRGSPALLMGTSLFFLIGSLGLGMFFSTVARSQLLATQLAMVGTFLPAYLLSGFMFAIDVMPRVLRIVTYVIPARYFLVVTRGIFLKGVGVPVLYVQGLSMLAYAAVGIALAARVFRKELE
ncbi:MAG: ABC transporter permease [Candidatus Eisenbacteria bacterium]|nr:ABC transporter permease [Candidatus Eisenbacteria bacterium]